MNIVDHLILGIALSPAGKGNAPAVAQIVPEPMPAWDPLCHHLLSGHLDGAFINLPLAMDLAGSGAGLTLVMLSHRGGSQLTGRKDRAKRSDFSGKSLLIPHNLSIQHMLMHKFLADQGLTLAATPSEGSGTVCAEAVPLNLMQEMLARDSDGDIAAMIAPAPVSSKGPDGWAPILSSQKLWKDHPCCGLVLRTDVVADAPDAVDSLVRHLFEAAQTLTHAMTEGGDENLADAAIAFLDPDQNLALDRDHALEMLKTCGVSYAPDLLVPDRALLEIIQTYMRSAMGMLAAPLDMAGLINPEFAQKALSELYR